MRCLLLDQSRLLGGSDYLGWSWEDLGGQRWGGRFYGKGQHEQRPQAEKAGGVQGKARASGGVQRHSLGGEAAELLVESSHPSGKRWEVRLSFHRRETKGPGEPEARSSDSRLVLGPRQLGKVEGLVVGVMGKH